MSSLIIKYNAQLNIGLIVFLVVCFVNPAYALWDEPQLIVFQRKRHADSDWPEALPQQPVRVVPVIGKSTCESMATEIATPGFSAVVFVHGDVH